MNPIQMESRIRIVRRWAFPVICASLVVQWTAGWTETTSVVLLAGLSAVAVWSGWHGIRHLVHHLRLRMAGHVTRATVVAYRVDHQSGDLQHVPLVSFATRAGEQRQLIPLTCRYEYPPEAPGDPLDRSGKRAAPFLAPPIGHSVQVVYDPADPTWADERASWSVVGVSTFQFLAMIVLFGALLIGTLATQIPAIRSQ